MFNFEEDLNHVFNRKDNCLIKEQFTLASFTLWKPVEIISKHTVLLK